MAFAYPEFHGRKNEDVEDFMERMEVLLDGISSLQYWEVPNVLLEAYTRVPNGALAGMLEML